MQPQNQEIISIIFIGGVLLLVLFAFVVVILFIYQKRQHAHEKDLVKLKEEYEQNLLRSQLEVQEKTLSDVGAELHDNIGQSLTFVNNALGNVLRNVSDDTLNHLTLIAENVRKTQQDVSYLTKSLYSDRISKTGLNVAIEYEVNRINKAELITTNFNTEGTEYEEEIDSEKAIYIFRIFQEAVNNILKYSKATHINIVTSFSLNNFTLLIEDNGIGFDVKSKQKANSVGLKSMSNRAKLIGADFSISSNTEKGTKITLVLPLTEHKSII